MFQRVAKYFLYAGVFFLSALLSNAVFAQRPAPGSGSASGPTSTNSSPLGGGDPTIDIDVYVRGADGAPIDVTAVVSLVAPMGQVLSQGTTLGGNIQFKGVAASQYIIQVVAAGFENAVKDFDGYNAGASRVIIDMRPSSNGSTDAASPQVLLAPKAQKELAKALEALRANKPGDARSHLETGYRLAPNHPAVNYLYGVYFLQMKDQEKAKSYWTKTLEFNPKHVSALLSMSEALLREQRVPDAESYVKKAVEADPNSWRAHAILADVFLKESQPNEAVKEADRAVELGQGQAVMVQPLLARALMESGNKERARRVLQEYILAYPDDAVARKQLDKLLAPVMAMTSTPGGGIAGTGPRVDTETNTEVERGISLPLPSNFLPPNIEKKEGTPEAEVAPKLQLALDQAYKALGPVMTSTEKAWAQSQLDIAYKIAPTSADVNYLYGVYSWQTNDRARAISFWAKAAEFDPKHYRAMLSLSQALVDETRPDEALPYLERAVQAEPFSWRAYALSAHVYLHKGLSSKTAKHAERALELGHEEAVVAERYLAAALAIEGERDKAVSLLQSYLRKQPMDTSAKRQLEDLQSSEGRNARDVADASSKVLLESSAVMAITPFPLTTTKWLPPDVDENVPGVEPGAACVVDDVVRKAGRRVEEFVKNVDRFTASEFMKHESIDKGGFVQREETRKSDYLVSIEEYRPGYFSVTEYRGDRYKPAEAPDGVETNGLPTLALIFHPKYAGNFAMSCEGLGEWNGRRAWQIHFRQRPDKPNTIRAYKFGENGQSYSVALKGRAWIAADSYQIERMETDLVAKLPEIRLVADHTVVDYGPVRFKNRNVEMWLPQSAEVYFDWRGKRVHRRHSFDNYLLFSVDEKQKIAEPRQETQSQPEN